MRLNPHLAFNGQCEAAFRFYEKTLHGQVVVMMTYGETPMAEQVPAEWRNKVVHATLEVGDQVLTGGDSLAERCPQSHGVAVLLHLDDADEADRVFAEFAEQGEVQMPLKETFWALRFGMLVDRFGTPWVINCGRNDATPGAR